MTWGEVLRHNAKQFVIAIDQALSCLVCTAFKETGYADESLSSRAYRWHMDGVRKWPNLLIDRLFFWEEQHCFQSYQSEREGKQLPPELR